MDDMELSGEEVDGTLADLMADRPRRTAIYEYRDSSTEIPTCLSRLGEREKKKKKKKKTKRERARSREDSRVVWLLAAGSLEVLMDGETGRKGVAKSRMNKKILYVYFFQP